MRNVGYEFLRSSLGIVSVGVDRPAQVLPVTRIVRNADHVAVPAHVAPQGTAPLEHMLFALKHEGVRLDILSQVVKHLDAGDLVAELARAPNGRYVRCACYLWETYNQKTLPTALQPGGAVVNLFDEAWYITAPGQKNARWRVAFNGLGTPQFCATVQKTDEITRLQNLNILQQSHDFLGSLDEAMLDRALAWAYLHETTDSFAIEREVPTENRARAFVQLLRQAHDGHPITEQYLVDLQSATVSNPFDKAVQFRTEQNYLTSGMRGAAGVSYAPPPSDLIDPLMQAWMAVANTLPKHVDPLVAASILSFGFVYLHPFMDGNGRLSRFIFHKALCDSGQMKLGLLLPVSAAMKRHEAQYLHALQTFSKPVREMTNVLWIDEGQYQADFTCGEAVWRFWDATRQVEFGLQMAEQALSVDLRNETLYLAQHDTISRQVNAKFDLRSADLSTLVMLCMDAGGTFSKNKRKSYADRVSSATLDYIEETTRAVMGTQPDAPLPL